MTYDEYMKNIEAMRESIKPVQTLPNLNMDWKDVGNVSESDVVHNAYNEAYLRNDAQQGQNVTWSDAGEWTHWDYDALEDISDEEYRHYIFDRNRSVMILHPQLYYMQEDGSHAIVDREEVIHIIPTGWIQLEIELLA